MHKQDVATNYCHLNLLNVWQNEKTVNQNTNVNGSDRAKKEDCYDGFLTMRK